MRNQSPTAIERRLTAIEQRSQPRAFDPSEARDPKTMTSWEIFARLEELRAKARGLNADRTASGTPAPTPSLQIIRIAARVSELRVRAVLLGGRPLPRRALPVTDELEADDA
jgi:hypothetical protein